MQIKGLIFYRLGFSKRFIMFVRPCCTLGSCPPGYSLQASASITKIIAWQGTMKTPFTNLELADTPTHWTPVPFLIGLQLQAMRRHYLACCTLGLLTVSVKKTKDKETPLTGHRLTDHCGSETITWSCKLKLSRLINGKKFI